MQLYLKTSSLLSMTAVNVEQQDSWSRSTSSLSVRLLISGSSSRSSKLLWLLSSRIRDQQWSIILYEDVLDFILGCFVNVLLIVCYQSLGHCLSDGIDLWGVSSSSNLYIDVDSSKLFMTQEQDRFQYLELQGIRLNQLKWPSIHSDDPLSSLTMSKSCSSLLPSVDLNSLKWFLSCSRHVVVGQLRQVAI